jgi:hypothetical protein
MTCGEVVGWLRGSLLPSYGLSSKLFPQCINMNRAICIMGYNKQVDDSSNKNDTEQNTVATADLFSFPRSCLLKFPLSSLSFLTGLAEGSRRARYRL